MHIQSLTVIITVQMGKKLGKVVYFELVLNRIFLPSSYSHTNKKIFNYSEIFPVFLCYHFCFWIIKNDYSI